MSELDDKLNSILSNPAMMQQIMSLAQALNQQPEAQQQPPPQASPPPQPPPQSSMPSTERMLNPNMLSRMASLMQRGSIDKNQQSV